MRPVLGVGAIAAAALMVVIVGLINLPGSQESLPAAVYHFATAVPTLSVVAIARRRLFQRVQRVFDTFRQSLPSSAPEHVPRTLE